MTAVLHFTNDNTFALAIGHAASGYPWLGTVPVVLWSAMESSRPGVAAAVMVASGSDQGFNQLVDGLGPGP